MENPQIKQLENIQKYNISDNAPNPKVKSSTQTKKRLQRLKGNAKIPAQSISNTSTDVAPSLWSSVKNVVFNGMKVWVGATAAAGIMSKKPDPIPAGH